MIKKCVTCEHFGPQEDRYFSGGFCQWRPPMVLRGLVWGAHNERIEKPEEEWCSEHEAKDA